MSTRRTYQTTLRRAHGAIYIGSLVGGALTMAFMFGARIWQNGLPDHIPRAWEDIVLYPMSLLFMMMIAAITFYIGLVFLAGPVWFLLHSVGFRDPISACALGAALTGLVNAYLMKLETVPWPAMTIIGGVVGYVVWYVAYEWSGQTSGNTSLQPSDPHHEVTG